MPFFVGCSGFSYPSWRGRFYPQELASRDYLAFYAQHFPAVELNVTFYRWPRPSTLRSWRQKVGPEFRFVVKLHQSITHKKRLWDTQAELARVVELVGELQPALLLAQLPPSLRFDPALLEDFVASLPAGLPPLAWEARHKSFFIPEALEFFTRKHLPLVVADSGGRYPTARVVTAWPLYLRFHGPGALYASKYTREQLSDYAQWVQSVQVGQAEVYAFFNNDVGGYALDNAQEFRQLLSPQNPCPNAF